MAGLADWAGEAAGKRHNETDRVTHAKVDRISRTIKAHPRLRVILAGRCTLSPFLLEQVEIR
jgi:hypothetical protein